MSICLIVISMLAVCGLIAWALETEARWRWGSQEREDDETSRL